MNPTTPTPTPIPTPTRDREALNTRAARRQSRARQQLLDHYRDLQAALHALSKDYGVLGIDLPYAMVFTKSFSAQAPGGPPVKAVLSLTLSEIPCPEPGEVANHKGRKSTKVTEVISEESFGNTPGPGKGSPTHPLATYPISDQTAAGKRNKG